LIHVTASVGTPDASHGSQVPLFGADSAELLQDYQRLFCPELGSNESDSLGIVSCVDGALGAYGGGGGGGPGQARQTLAAQRAPSQGHHQHYSPHQVRHSHNRSVYGVPSMSSLARMQSTASSVSSPFGQLAGIGPSMARLRDEKPIEEGVCTHTPRQMHVETASQRVERSLTHPPLSWAMRVSSPRPGAQRVREDADRACGVVEGDELVQDVMVGMDGAYESYCKQIITPALNAATTTALERMRNLQQEIEVSMMGQPGVTKATIPRKFFCSLKEVSKVVKDCKLLVVAPDIKPSATAHIKPVKMLNALIEDADSAGVPYVFALSRKGIGQIFGKDKNMSIMALMDLDPIKAEVALMLEEAGLGRRLWAEKSRDEGILEPII
jgi:ribosomal protein L7Ae-like RNA K-turn-binding protein